LPSVPNVDLAKKKLLVLLVHNGQIYFKKSRHRTSSKFTWQPRSLNAYKRARMLNYELQ